MSTTARPRPRPKPRPRVPTAAPSSPGPSNSYTSPPPTVPPALITTEDEDALFARKPVLSRARKPPVVEKRKRKKSRSPVSSSSSEVEVQEVAPIRSKPKPKPKKTTTKKNVLPHWTKSSNILIDLSDEDDDIIEQRLADTAPSNKTKRPRPDTEKSTHNKRQRSRSRSITPPPEVSQQLLQNAVARIRDIIPIEVRAPSPTNFADESADTIVLDPELASIKKLVRSGQLAHTPSGSRGTTPALDGGPEIVTIRVKWKSHPMNESAKSQQWDFKMKRHDSFKYLFEETADEAGVLSDNLIVTHNGARVFSSASPHAIGIWAETELEACDKVTFEWLRARAQQRRSASLEPDFATSAKLDYTGSLPPTQEETEGGSEAESAVSDKDDKFKIILRSQGNKDITLTVRPTTKCGAIVKAFLKNAGLTDQYPGAGEVGGSTTSKRGRKNAPPSGGPWLMIDGDKMANHVEIGEADLEDGDMVDVTGL